MHRPFDGALRPVRPHPRETSWDGGEPDPAQVDPAVLGALLRPARLAAARRSRGPLRAAGRRPGPARAAPACSCRRAAPSPTARTCSARRSSRWPAARAPSAREVLVGLAVPSDEIRWWRDVPAGPARAPRPGPSQEQLRARRPPDAARRGARHARRGPATTAPGTGGRPQASLEERPGRRRAPGGRRLTAFVPVGERPRRRRPASTRPCTPPARPPTTSGPPAAWRPSTRAVEAGRQPRADRGADRAGARHGGRPDRRRVGARRPGSPRGARRRPEPVEFSPGDLPALREAGARYLREEPSVPVRITGAVVRMRRSGPRGDGHGTAAGARRRRGAARPGRAGRGGVPDRRARAPGRAAGPGARPAGEPGRLPAAHRRDARSCPCRSTRRSGTG